MTNEQKTADIGELVMKLRNPVPGNPQIRYQAADKLEEQARALTALEAENKALRDALEPFAKAIEPDETCISGWRFGIPTRPEHNVAARRALGEKHDG